MVIGDDISVLFPHYSSLDHTHDGENLFTPSWKTKNNETNIHLVDLVVQKVRHLLVSYFYPVVHLPNGSYRLRIHWWLGLLMMPSQLWQRPTWTTCAGNIVIRMALL